MVSMGISLKSVGKRQFRSLSVTFGTFGDLPLLSLYTQGIVVIPDEDDQDAHRTHLGAEEGRGPQYRCEPSRLQFDDHRL